MGWLEFGIRPLPPQEVEQFTWELKDHLKQTKEAIREKLEVASNEKKAQYDIFQVLTPRSSLILPLTQKESKKSEATKKIRRTMNRHEAN